MQTITNPVITVSLEASLDTNWQIKLSNIINQPFMVDLNNYLTQENKSKTVIYPPKDLIFNAFNLTNFNNIKVVILGQDPYHNIGQAHGLAFSVPNGIKPPPSLVNIYKELLNDLGEKKFKIPSHGNLTKWAERGVLLLNTVLTVRAHEAFSHRNKGWELFTDNIIRLLSDQKNNLVFVLWGEPAKAKIKLIDNKKHLVLTSAHPSPLSAYRGFFGCKHFSKINKFLTSNKLQPIDWQI